MLATRKQRHQNHYIRGRKEPLACLLARRCRRAQEAQVLAAGKTAKMLWAHAREARNLCFGEDLLAGSNGYAHRRSLDHLGQWQFHRLVSRQA